MQFAAPLKLPAYDARQKHWNVVIESPKGCQNKYKFEPELGAWSLSGVLPEGMSFPYDFGFLPRTRGEDGDPLDVLLLMDEPAFPGCIVPSRLIGVIEAEQTERDGEVMRNDRFVAVPLKGHLYATLRTLKDLGEQRLHEIQRFFVAYNRTKGKRFKVIHLGGPRRAETLARLAGKRRR